MVDFFLLPPPPLPFWGLADQMLKKFPHPQKMLVGMVTYQHEELIAPYIRTSIVDLVNIFTQITILDIITQQ
jgi:hypothetical protein